MNNSREELPKKNDSDKIERQEKKSDKWNESLFDRKASQHIQKSIKNGKIIIKN